MQPKPEPIVEKLLGGGTSFFFPDDVLDVSQGDKCVLVVLKTGSRPIQLIDETLTCPIPGQPSAVSPATTYERVQRRIAGVQR
jgi:hypothetical protein